ncbi:MAG: ATP-binding protein [Gammaproteobacteria bacterium]|nr:ATP-binding protein [Gammaproteobacteria bacterium]
MYHSRHLEQKLLDLSQYFKVIILTGSRQVGKSTLLTHLFPTLKHIVFDPVQDLFGARSDPDLFLANFPPPVILDEIQFVPELLAAIKRKVDESPSAGQYFLTGSQNFSLLKATAESLAGRAAILHLGGMTSFELADMTNNNWLGAYLTNPESVLLDPVQILPSTETLYAQLWRGSFPAVNDLPAHIVPEFYTSYLQTYIERDVRLLGNIRDLHEFSRFLGLCAALTAQEINHAQLAREIGLAQNTAAHWLDVLTYSYLWQELWPYHGNTIKRLSKKRKGYITDTGMACYLQRISTPEALAGHPLLGALFESFCVNMLLNLSTSLPLAPKFYHWRTNAGAEVDLILELNARFYPIEIKCKATLSGNDGRGIMAFRDSYPGMDIAPALILYAGQNCYRLNPHIIAMPWNRVLV